MRKRGKKDETIEDIVREFKQDMQRMVDRKGSGVSKMTLSFKGEEFVVAERKTIHDAPSDGEPVEPEDKK